MKKTLLLIAINISLFGETLETIIVDGSKESSTSIGVNKISQKKMKKFLQENGDIGSVLKNNPNIKVQDKNNDIESISDITPSKIEINGAKFYQNLFLIDGVSNDSSLDPAYTDKYAIQDVPGNENAMFIDLDLIESIDVYDSAIPVKFGNFNGGVIDAKTKRAGAIPESKISYKTTNDTLVNMHLKEISSHDDASDVLSVKKLDFKKTFFTASHSTPIDDKNGILGTYSYKNSTTPKRTFNTFKNTEQESHNFLLKYSHYFDDDSILDLTGTYANFENQLFKADIQNSEFTNITSGMNLSANYEKNFDFWKLDSVLSLGTSKNSRENSTKDFKKWRRQGSKDWGVEKESGEMYSIEGGYGNIEKTENNINLNLDLTSNEFLLGQVLNKINTGFQYRFGQSNYQRNEDSYIYNNTKNDSDVICNGSTQDCENGSQYFTTRQVYKAEDVDVNISGFATYIDNIFKYKRFEITPGVRVDYNTYLKNFDFAPRLNSSYDIFGNGKTKIFGGLNRYYDKSFLGFKLREARSPYQTEYRSTYQNELNSSNIPNGQINPTIWNPSADKGDNKYLFSSLDTPYSDEQVLGLSQNFSDNTIMLKYVIREGKNQFLEEKKDYRLFTNPNGTLAYYKPIKVTNNGKTKYNALTISLYNNNPIKIGAFDFSYNFSTNINTVNKANFNDYNYEDKTISKDKAYLDGKLVDYNDIDLNQEKQTFNLNFSFENMKTNIFGIPTNISLYNYLRYTDKYKGIYNLRKTVSATETTPDQQSHAIEVGAFETKQYKGYFTFDTKLAMDFNLYKKQKLTTTVEVINLFDEKIEENFDKQYYNIGRQFWFQVAYKF